MKFLFKGIVVLALGVVLLSTISASAATVNRQSNSRTSTTATPIKHLVVIFDENISFDAMEKRAGADLAGRLRDLTLKIYTRAAEHAWTKGILIADTKFEFGTVEGELVLGDEALTPDSSRFWPLDTYEPGRAQDSYDKQFVRDYLERIRWPKSPPAPPLPPEIAARTSEKYKEAFRALTPESRYPIAAVFVEIDPDLVDVNVHPTKTEVKFTRDGEVHHAVSQAVTITDPSQVRALMVDSSRGKAVLRATVAGGPVRLAVKLGKGFDFRCDTESNPKGNTTPCLPAARHRS